jgi:hypothetical protein
MPDVIFNLRFGSNPSHLLSATNVPALSKLPEFSLSHSHPHLTHLYPPNLTTSSFFPLSASFRHLFMSANTIQCKSCHAVFKSIRQLQGHHNFGQCCGPTCDGVFDTVLTTSHLLGGITDQEIRSNIRSNFPSLETDDPSIADDANHSDNSAEDYYDDPICFFDDQHSTLSLKSDISDGFIQNDTNFSVAARAGAEEDEFEWATREINTEYPITDPNTTIASNPHPTNIHLLPINRSNHLFRGDPMYIQDSSQPGFWEFNVSNALTPKVQPQPVDFAWLSLMQMLDDARCPRNMSDKIIDWIRDAKRSGFCFDSTTLPKRQTYTKRLIARMSPHGIIPIKPNCVSVQLQQTFKSGSNGNNGPIQRLTAKVHVWNFRQQLQSLLSDHTIFGDLEKLIVNPQNPFLPIPPEMESQIGSWYIKTIATKRITGYDGRILLAFGKCLDKTWKSMNGTLTCEPLLVTLINIKAPYLYNPRCWRIAAMIPNLESHSKALRKKMGTRVDTRSASQTNYNACLQAALHETGLLQLGNKASSMLSPEELKTELASLADPNNPSPVAQHNTDADFSFVSKVRFGAYERHMKIVLAWSHLIVDGLGADQVTMRKQVYKEKCQSADTPLEEPICSRGIPDDDDDDDDVNLDCPAESPNNSDSSTDNDSLDSCTSTNASPSASIPRRCPISNTTAKSGVIKRPRICRGCTCPPSAAGDSFHQCRPIDIKILKSDCADIQDQKDTVVALNNAVSDPAVAPNSKVAMKKRLAQTTREYHKMQKTYLDTHCVHPVKNATWELDFGASSNGIYSAVRVDVMHAGDGGIGSRLIANVLGPKDDENLANKAFIDGLALRLFRSCPRQTVQNERYPRLSFSKGITSFSFLACHEWVGVGAVLALLSGFQPKYSLPILSRHITFSPNKNKVASKIPKTRVDDIALQNRAILLQVFACFQAWYRNGPFDALWVTGDAEGSLSYEAIDRGIRGLGDLLTRAFPRSDGNGWNLQKFHDLFCHFLKDKKDAGTELTNDADVTEFMHKYYAKIPGSTAINHGTAAFDASVSQRLTERQFLDEARRLFSIKTTENQKDVHEKIKLHGHNNCAQIRFRQSSCDVNSPPSVVIERKPMARLYIRQSDEQRSQNGNNNTAPNHLRGQAVWLGSGEKVTRNIHPVVCQSLSLVQETTPHWGALISHDIDNHPCIEIMTEVTFSNGMRIRCHPDYPSSGAWYDWVMVSWEVAAGDPKIIESCPSPYVWCWSDESTKKFVHRDANSKRDHLYDIRQSKHAGGRKYFNEIVTDLTKHIDTDEYKPIVPAELSPIDEIIVYAPAKVLALVQIQDGSREMCALIHGCNYNSKTNSLLSREWQLEYTCPKKVGEASLPVHHLIPLSSMECPCYVVEECPGVFESRPGSTFVHEVFDRKSHWSTAFLEICKGGLSKYEATEKSKEGPTRTSFELPSRKDTTGKPAAKKKQRKR